MNILNLIIAYENGEMNTKEEIELFARLVESGMAWSLQGHYGRAAKYLIDLGAIDVKGNIYWDKIVTFIES
jgi:hypothetical protein